MKTTVPLGRQSLTRTENTSGAARRYSPWRRFWRRLFRHKLGIVGSLVLVILVIMAIFAPWVARQDPHATDLRSGNRPPSAEHILGTDAVGRDVWARLVYGSRVSLSVGVLAVGIYAVIGVLLGGLAGLAGGVVDTAIMRITDVMMCFPTLLLMITVAVLLPPSIFNVMIIIGIFGWTGICRLVRGQVLSLREQDFVLAATMIGAPRWRILSRHILPNVVGSVVVSCTLGLAGAIMSEANLSFLGLGVQEPTPSWGSTLQVALNLPTIADLPWRWIPPAIAIAVTVLAVNFLGDGLRDALDPRMTID